jgi:RNA polymerase sigma factor (TIGR02999 family)
MDAQRLHFGRSVPVAILPLTGRGKPVRRGYPLIESPRVTQLLAAYRAGDRSALDQAFSRVYDDLRRAASAQLRRGSSPTLNTTSLVNEAYLRLVDGARAAPTDRAHFLALAARAMRYIIIDYARERGAAKRGGGAHHVELDESEIAIDDQTQQLLALDEAMQVLGRLDERLVRLVECRFFTGMTEEETAQALGVSLSTVQRDWKRARAWLSEEMGGPAT